jgi:hypothetical protein
MDRFHPALTLIARCTAVAALFAAADPALAGDNEFRLVIQDHRFQPAEVIVPAERKVKLVIENGDPTPEEFESHALNREKVIAGKATVTIFIGPLKPGRYGATEWWFTEFYVKGEREGASNRFDAIEWPPHRRP